MTKKSHTWMIIQGIPPACRKAGMAIKNQIKNT
jgi:hypothetical protein